MHQGWYHQENLKNQNYSLQKTNHILYLCWTAEAQV